MTTVPQRLAQLADATPDQRCMILLEDQQEVHLTYRELAAAAQTYARGLREAGVQPGDLISIIQLDLRHTLLTFWGALWLGAAPSITPPPLELSGLVPYVQSLHRRVSALGIRAVVADQRMSPVLATLPCRVLDFAQIAAPHDPDSELPPILTDPSVTAYVQFSSGTTGEPRGIAVTHQAVLGHLADYAERQRIRADSVLVNWLPMFHDMGLVGAMMVPVCYSALCVLIPTLSWLRNPVSLFQAVDKYRGTAIIMPNFGFSYSVRSLQPSDLEGLNLSTLRRVASGAEPINYEALEAFEAHLAPYGLNPLSLSTGYGFAEAVLAITSLVENRGIIVDWIDMGAARTAGRAVPAPPGAPGSQAIVSCGTVYPHTELRIVGVDGQPLGEREIGEITARTPWLFEGVYLGDESHTNVLEDGWFHSGDIGYMANEELYVLGRIKDLIIVAGGNIHPHPIEMAAQDVPGVRRGRAVAFGVPDPRLGTEAIVLVAETMKALPDEDRRLLAMAIRRRIREMLGLVVGDVYLVEKGWIRKTTSGKLARGANREKYLAARADQPHTPPQGELEERLVQLWEELLGVDPIGMDDNFFALGGTSMLAATLLARIEQDVGRRVPIGTLMTATTIREFAKMLVAGQPESANNVLVALQPHGEKPPLYLIHPAGGHLLRFYDLLRYLPLDQPVYGLQALGLDGKAEPHTSIEDMADYYLNEIRAVQPEGPHYLCGFSLGGAVAFEMARRLRAGGGGVWVGLLDTRPPAPRKADDTPRAPSLSPRRMVRSLKRDVAQVANLPATERATYLRERVKKLWRAHVTKRIKLMFSGPEEYRQRTQTPEARVIAACRLAAERYNPQPYEGRITYFRAIKGSQPAVLERWERKALGGTEVIEVPGGHQSMLDEPHVRELAKAILAALQAEQARHTADAAPADTVTTQAISN